MKKMLFSVLALLLFVSCQTNTSDDVFKPYQTTDLRLPAVPIVVNDPYFSIWSPYDRLTDGLTRHWTGAEKPITAFLRVDGTVYRVMGAKAEVLKALLPVAAEEKWEAPHSRTYQKGWEMPDFDDSAWSVAAGAFGDTGADYIHTKWAGDNTDVFVRRTVELTEDMLAKDFYLKYSHDDVFQVFVNGVEVLNTGETWKSNQKYMFDEVAKSALRPGKNVIAAHCHNTYGGAMLDYGLYYNPFDEMSSVQDAKQKSVDVLATSSYYTMECGPVELDLVFTAPVLIDDYDLLSTPINYISYQVRPTDGKEHQVQFYLDASAELTVNTVMQPTHIQLETVKGTQYLKCGTIEQPMLAKKGDNICIDWGYLYLPAVNGCVAMGNLSDMQNQFVQNGSLPESPSECVNRDAAGTKVLAYLHDFGTVKDKPQSSFAMIGYDEVLDIEYLHQPYKAYWTHNGTVSIYDAFEKLKNNYQSIMKRCRALDQRIYDDGLKAGDKKYAEILSAAYRHVIVAHKLFQDKDGNLLFFSKENDSNGSVNTVDLTYPEAPLFLVYNPELQKAMMTSILDYSLSGRWTKPFAAHDMGTYPIANGQTYGGDMPLEESGNMLTLAATICQLDGNTKYVDKYWDILTQWNNYLVENGQDPAEQLCTDDFAGHWAHNCNLSAKAIMGILAYSRMADMRGEKEVAQKYEALAKQMAQKWEEDARDGDDHYRLAYDRPDTWSQKYNMVWDKLWNTHIFPNNAIEKEIQYYLGKQNTYGLPLDCRRDYTKSDWIMWTAAMASDKATFQKFVDPLYKYIDETPSRVAISDWHDTKTGRYEHFIGRSVIGGYWMKVLMDKIHSK